MIVQPESQFGLKIPSSDKKLEIFFRALIPEDAAIVIRPMFGNVAAFVNGNLFSGLYGSNLFVRLSNDRERNDLLKVEDAKIFEPMKGRLMKEYVCVPREWLTQASLVTPWISRSLESTRKLPPKQQKRMKKGNR